MTYDAREKSVYGGEPIEIYKFDREGVSTWYYTSADMDMTVGGNLYRAAAIKRNDIEGSQDVQRAALKITMPADADFPMQFVALPPTDRIMVEVRRYHFLDSDISFLWIGRVVNVEHAEFKAIVLCESVVASLRRPTLRRVYQTTCPHLLYGDECTLSKAGWSDTVTLEGASGVTLVSSAFAAMGNGYYTGGIVEIVVSGNVNRAFITFHSDVTITTSLPLQGAVVGLSVTVCPGCNHSLDACVGKFNNSSNYGGFPYMPTKNPMSGVPIF
jgi:uncharacterized phage protein (TIGR02218 family)